MKQSKVPGERPIRSALYSAANAWRDHRTGCEVCLRVSISRPSTVALCCYVGATLLKAALADATARRVFLTDKGEEMLNETIFEGRR